MWKKHIRKIAAAVGAAALWLGLWTTQFNDGRTLTIYYKKSGMQCEVYSPCNANDYNVSDASKIKSTNFEVVDKVEGKLYKKASIGEVTRLIKRLVNQYL